MNGRIIADAIAINPLAEFARKPARNDTKAIRVRGLKQITSGTWLVAESTDPITGVWRKYKPSDRPRMTSRELVTVEDAEAQVQARITRNAEYAAAYRKADSVTKQLMELGVDCRRLGVRVVVHDATSLGRLLARVPT